MDKLLRLLSENSNYTTAQLSMMLGEPEEAIEARIKEYEDSGVIRGYQAVVNWDDVPESGRYGDHRAQGRSPDAEGL